MTFLVVLILGAHDHIAGTDILFPSSESDISAPQSMVTSLSSSHHDFDIDPTTRETTTIDSEKTGQYSDLDVPGEVEEVISRCFSFPIRVS